MYQRILKSFGKLATSLSSTSHIDINRSAKSYEHYSLEILRGYNYRLFYNIGDVCWVEFGNNLMPEMSYLHMAVILKRFDKIYYVLPITTYESSNSIMRNAYHPTDNPNGNNAYLFMKHLDYSFLTHDSVLKTSELRPVSIKRIKSRCGSISTNDFDEIDNIIFKRLFAPKDREDFLLRKENSLLKLKLELTKIPNTIVDISTVNIDTSFNLEIIQKTNNAIEIKLTDKYGQSETKIINIKQDE